MSSDPSGPIPASGDFVLTHVFDATRDLVWNACTQPDHLARWWGPLGFKMLTTDVNFRPGSLFRYSRQAPDGTTTWGRGEYRTIEPPKRLVVVVSFTDPEGHTTRHPKESDWPLSMVAGATLEEQGGRTFLTLIVRPEGATDSERQSFRAGRDSMKQGFSFIFAALAAYLGKRQNGPSQDPSAA